MTITRDELHRLVDEVPQDQLPNASSYLRELVHDHSHQRTFRSRGAFSGPTDLAARSKDIIRDELGGTQ